MAESSPANSAIPAKGSRVVVPRQLKLRHHLGAFLLYVGFRLFSFTWRCRYVDPHGFLNQPARSVIYCSWHNRLALSMTIWERVRRKAGPPSKLAALISASHDGGLLAKALSYFQVEAVRGSSSRRGAQALLELTSYTDQGYSVAITPDGPRGPRYVVRDGIIALAQLTGSPIIPVSVHIRGKLVLKSWDRFQVPWPFARCEIRIGMPLHIPREPTEERRTALKEELQRRMMELTED